MLQQEVQPAIRLGPQVSGEMRQHPGGQRQRDEAADWPENPVRVIGRSGPRSRNCTIVVSRYRVGPPNRRSATPSR